MDFAMNEGGWGAGKGLDCHIPIMKNDFFLKLHLESFTN